MLRTWYLLAVVAALVAAGSPDLAARQKAAPDAAAKQLVVNLNTATAAELEELPGIGPKTAARIVEYREKNGPFKKIEDLMNVQGIGEKAFLKLRSQISVGGGPAVPKQP